MTSSTTKSPGYGISSPSVELDFNMTGAGDDLAAKELPQQDYKRPFARSHSLRNNNNFISISK